MNVNEIIATLVFGGGSGGGGEGGGVTPAQLAAGLATKQDKVNTVTVADTAATISPVANTVYQCGELTSLTVSNPLATGAYAIVFTSGSTATTTTIPTTILGLEDFAAEANTVYEINVLDNRAVVGSWAVSA